MQYTALGFRWEDETVANRKDDYQKRLEASRYMGIMDTNIDGKVAKTEVRGRMGTRCSPTGTGSTPTRTASCRRPNWPRSTGR